MNDTDTQIVNLQGEIEELEADIDYMWFYALYILEDTDDLQEQIKPLSDKIISLEAEIKELLKLL